MEQGAKPFWQSKTLWGAVLLVLGAILSSFGVEVTPSEQETIAISGLQMVGAGTELVGLVMVIYGRFKAKQKLTAK